MKFPAVSKPQARCGNNYTGRDTPRQQIVACVWRAKAIAAYQGHKNNGKGRSPEEQNSIDQPCAARISVKSYLLKLGGHGILLRSLEFINSRRLGRAWHQRPRD